VDFEVGLELAQPLETLFGSHLWSGIAIRVPMRGQQQHVPQQASGDDLAARVVATIVDERVRGLMRAWTRGPIRWRLGFASGHKRAVVWRVARDVTAAAPELVNDPTATTWDLLVDESMGTLDIVPRRLVDPRFAWRVADVPAASQPSVAAALVWVAGMRDDDRVWDPFCGSGLEIVERARRGRFARLVGSDIDETALAAARANAEAAAAHVEIVRGDARTLAVGEIDCAITNPPLGSRVHVDAAQLLIETVPNIARQLVRGGRLVWITPALKKTTSACERAGLTRTRSLYVDLGGVRGHLERWEKR
jgi:precorrin-6B methylase 2